jgi:hypothetical protein
MAFFERKGIWKSLLDVGKDESVTAPADPYAASLEDAATISRFLSSEENVRPALVSGSNDLFFMHCLIDL